MFGYSINVFTFTDDIKKILLSKKLIGMVGVGLINRELSRIVSQPGHMDQLMGSDAVLPNRKDVEVVSLAFAEIFHW